MNIQPISRLTSRVNIRRSLIYALIFVAVSGLLISSLWIGSSAARGVRGVTNGGAVLVPATTFTSAQSGDWATAATWSPNGVPGSADTVTINNGHTVTVGGGQTVGDMTVNGVLAINSSVTFIAVGSVTNNGTISGGNSASAME